MEKKFTKIEIAAIKRTAQNVQQFVAKKESIDKKIEALEEEKKALQPMIDAFQGPIKEMTGGYTTEDLVRKEIVKTGKLDPKTGKEVTSTRYVLVYPDTVIPPAEEPEVEDKVIDVPMTEVGNDYDLDKESVEQDSPVMATDDPWA